MEGISSVAACIMTGKPGGMVRWISGTLRCGNTVRAPGFYQYTPAGAIHKLGLVPSDAMDLRSGFRCLPNQKASDDAGIQVAGSPAKRLQLVLLGIVVDDLVGRKSQCVRR